MKIVSLVIFYAVFSLFCQRDAMVEVEVCLSKEEFYLYKIIMKYRKGKGLKSIPYSSKLTRVAQMHAQDVSTHYDYENRESCNPHSWSSNGAWTPCCYTNDHKRASCMWDKPKEITEYAGSGYEIVYYSSSGARALEGLTGWKKSRPHNALLVNSGIWKKVKWQGIGVGIYKEYGVVWFGEILDEKSRIVRCN